MKKIKEIIIVLAAIVTIITGIIGYINLALVKDLFEKILEYKLIVGIIIAIIVIAILFVKFFSIICSFFKWLSAIYFKFIWKIIGIEKWFKEENKRLPLKVDMELQKAIDATFSDGQKKQTFINDYNRIIKKINEDDRYTLDILNKFWKKRGTMEFIKYLEGFFEALSYWSDEKFRTWTLLLTKRKEAEFRECIKHIDNGNLEEFQIKCARIQSIIPEKVFFIDFQNYIK